MDRIWLASYQKGVPADINENSLQTLSQMMATCCLEYHDAIAFSCMGHDITYGELSNYAESFAAFLLGRFGLKKGDRVALMMPNVLQYPIALHGALRAGLTVVNVNPLYTARELKHQLNDAGCEALVILENFAHTFQQIAEETTVRKVIVTGIGDLFSFPKKQLVNFVVRHVKKMVPVFNIPQAVSFSQVLEEGQKLPFEPHNVTLDDPAFLQYTGGTTGVSKGAILTHRNMSANIEQASHWLYPSLSKRKEVVITALPLYHIFSLTANCLTMMRIGARNILITNPRDIPDFIKTLRKYPFSVITGVNTLFNALLNHPEFKTLDFSQLRISLGGGMAVQKAVADRWQGVTKAPLCQAYGLTETSPAVCINPLDIKKYNGTIGVPVSSTYVSIRDDQNNELPIGQEGELCVKGPQVMRGYWNKEEETQKVFTSDGWLKTGDMAKMAPDGFVTIVDRKKDMIIVSGFNVYPNEIEDVVAAHPKVLEVAAIGVPDERSGETVKLFIVKRDQSLTEEEVKEFCRQNLTGYKIPKHVEFRQELPKTNVGKILRRALR